MYLTHSWKASTCEHVLHIWQVTVVLFFSSANRSGYNELLQHKTPIKDGEF